MANENEFIDSFAISLAMWADEHLFGHGISDADYDREAERFAEELAQRAYETLMERPVR